ncbi:amidohydrolase [Haloprofundus marisrubri]|uniref:Amidohydrolase n=1 Tax=Haloprofundus marisrubri TaxID=1514971 RepID=A0A0W1R9V3_9EURY|nr:amidohydrolase family protein [Haloprofundus marisrubri]KTG10151.1 amidohydrolase [Haloprofundus marisrubri]
MPEGRNRGAKKFDLLLHGDLWDAEHGRRSDRWVGVADGDIVTISTDRPGDAAVVYEAALFTPGLVDMHVHLVWDGSDDPVATLHTESEQDLVVRAVETARAQLAGGVTTVRDVGSVDDVAITVARAIRAGRIPGPRVLASGRTVIITDGHDPFWGRESDGPDECRRAVRELRGAGADLIKVSATGGVYGQAVGEDPGVAELSRAELDAIVDEAHRFGLPVAAHAVGTEGIRNAVEAGVDTIEHGNLMDDATLGSLVDAGLAYDPTLFVYREIATSDDVPPYARANAEGVAERHWEVFEAALAADARVIAGSDAGSPGTPHPSLHRELGCLVDGGMTESEALTAATLTAATELGVPELGVVEDGTSADVVGFAADPLADITETGRPSVVVKDGAVVPR